MLKISYGMGFFKIVGQKGHYYIKQSDRKQYHDMMNAVVQSLNDQGENRQVFIKRTSEIK